MGTLLNGCLVLLATTTGVSLSVPAPAAWATHVATGQTCALTSALNILVEPDVQSGHVIGGTATATVVGTTIAIRCTVQVGAAGATHAGPDAVTVSSTPGQTTTLPPTAVSYNATFPGPVFLCTEWTVSDPFGTTTYYYDASVPAFSTSASDPCVAATGPVGPGQIYTVQSQPANV